MSGLLARRSVAGSRVASTATKPIEQHRDHARHDQPGPTARPAASRRSASAPTSTVASSGPGIGRHDASDARGIGRRPVMLGHLARRLGSHASAVLGVGRHVGTSARRALPRDAAGVAGRVAGAVTAGAVAPAATPGDRGRHRVERVRAGGPGRRRGSCPSAMTAPPIHSQHDQRLHDHPDARRSRAGVVLGRPLQRQVDVLRSSVVRTDGVPIACPLRVEPVDRRLVDLPVDPDLGPHRGLVRLLDGARARRRSISWPATWRCRRPASVSSRSVS